MPLNITPLITQLEARIAAADSQSSTSYLMSLNRLAQDYNNYNTISVTTKDDLPNADSSILGDVVYVKDTWKDSFGSFFIGMQSVDSDGSGGSVYGSPTWSRIILNADSDEKVYPLDWPDAPANLGGGTTSGYQAGGTLVWATPTTQITKVPFATDIPSQGNETLHTGVRGGYGAQDRTGLNGYVLGGVEMSGSGQKWPFAAGGTGTIAFTGQTFVNVSHGGSWSSETDAYLSVQSNTNASIAKMTFASDTTMSDNGYDMFQAAYDQGATAVSETHGYLAGGVTSVPAYAHLNTIQKYAFTNTTNGVDVGDLTQTLNGQGGGHSSSTHGFSAGGITSSSAIVSTIQSWPFASDGNAVNVGTLITARHRQANWSSNDNGYIAGGWNTPSTTVTQAHEKYAFNTGTSVSLTAFAGAVYGPGIQY